MFLKNIKIETNNLIQGQKLVVVSEVRSLKSDYWSRKDER